MFETEMGAKSVGYAGSWQQAQDSADGSAFMEDCCTRVT